MVVDTSSLVALLLVESSAPAIAGCMERARHLVISASTLVETTIVIEARLGADGVLRLQRLLREAEVEVVPMTPEHTDLAIDGWRRFGKGRHPAKLNLGDCFAYALARQRDEALLCVGRGFSRTDIAVLPRRLDVDEGPYEVPPAFDQPLPDELLRLFD